METSKVAFSPSFDLFSVPSSSSMILSMAAWSQGSLPTSAGAITVFTFSTAFLTPFPRNAFPMSLSSHASCSPVLAPLGTMERKTPRSMVSSTSTIGLPRL